MGCCLIGFLEKAAIKVFGQRIFLKPLTSEFISEDYIRWMQDENILQFLTGRDKSYNVDELERYVAQMEKSPHDWLFGIFLKEGDKHIGNIKIGNANFLHRFGDIGLIIGNKDCWGKGYGTEAITLATEYAFNQVNLNKLLAGMIVDNVGSYKAFMKAGYREAGRLKSHVLVKGQFVDAVLVEKCKDMQSSKRKDR